ncbi:DUF4214 domain-containing protein [Marinobacter sp. S6332]|uniref:DUF4214 domain-containing protein n=1 Tax=Marinobacter sp. S6332 TaxID=2926403 RepID=UPI001FF10EDB|nr:DUF4214 domain-containing protein [Marinobacter sp. S6332]MCK0163730.1 DUF4214 domain-containing protein [Marinobacter sp. S6332]
MATVKEQVQQIYVGLLGRAADKEGLDYWVGEIESGAMTIEEVRSNAVNEQPEGQAIFDSGKTRTEIVTALYENLFEKTPDATGLEYWVNGDGASVNADQLVLALINGAGTADAQVLANKVEAAQYYTDNAGATGEEFRDDARAAVEDVDGDSASVDASKSATDALDQEPSEPTDPSVPGESFMLTEGRDVVTGTADDDTFVGLVGQNQDGAISNALSTGDRIDGGTGRDTIEATMIFDNEVDIGGNNAPRPITNSVEEVYIESLENVTLDATRMEDVEEFWSDFSSDDLTIENINIRGDKLAITKDITFGIKDAEHSSDFHAQFDTEALVAQAPAATGSQLRINLMDLGTEDNPFQPDAPLGQLNVNGFRFTVDGVQKEITSEEIDAAKTYAELFAAIQNAIAAAAAEDESLEGLEVSLEENGFNTAPFVALLEDGSSTAQIGDSIVIRDENGRTLEGTQFVQEGNTTEFTLYGRFSEEEPEIVGNLIESNLILDNAGRGSTIGDVSIGGASNSNEGVEKINLVVDRSSAINSLNVGGLAEAQGTRDLQEIELTSTGADGSLRINNLEDVQTFNATGFEGANLVLGTPASDGVDLLDAEDHYYNTSDTNATMYIDIEGEIDPDLTIGTSQGNLASDANFSLNVTTAGGNDTIHIDTAGQLGIGSNGTASQFNDHLNLGNVNVSTGGGADTVVTQGYGVADITTGSGNDWIRTDNSGDFAKFLLNGDPAVSGVNPDQWANSLVGDGNTAYNMFKTKVKVEFLGVESDWIEIDSSNFRTTARQINDAIKSAIDNDNELAKLLTYEDTRNEGLVIESLVDRVLAADGSDFNISFLAPRMTDGTNEELVSDDYDAQSTVSNTELQDAWETYVNSTWGDGSNSINPGNPFNGLNAEGDVLNTIDGIVGGLNGDAYLTDGAHQDNAGFNSGALTQNVVNAGAGDDVIVLSSNTVGGFDTVVFEGNFGHDTIVNFNTDTLGGTSRDVLDFTSYLDAAANGRGTSANAEDKVVDKSVQYDFIGNVGTAVGGAGNFGYHNTIAIQDLSALWADIGTNKPGNFYGLTQDQVKAALEENNQGTAYDQDDVGMTSVLLVAKDQEINEDGTLGANVANKDEAIVYVVRIASVAQNGDVTFEVAEKGSFQLAKAFSDLDDLDAADFAGTPEAVAAEAAIAESIEDYATADVVIDTAVTDVTGITAGDNVLVTASGSLTAEAADIVGAGADVYNGEGAINFVSVATGEVADVNTAVGTMGASLDVTAQIAGTTGDLTTLNASVDTLDFGLADVTDAIISTAQLSKVANEDAQDALTVGGVANADALTATDAVDTFDVSGLANGDSATLNGLAALDAIDATGTATFATATDSDTSDNTIGTVDGGTDTGTVDATGEWQLATDTGVLTYFDGTATVEVTLTGVSDVTANGTAVLEIA